MRRPLVAMAAALVALATSAVATAGSRPADVRPYSVNVLPSLGGEPSLAVSPNGRNVMVTGGGANPSRLFLSTDGGGHYRALNPVFPKKGGADFDIIWLDDHTLVAADLSLQGDGVLVHRSTDLGATWTSTSILNDVYDRPWVAHHGNTVFVVTRGVADAAYLYISNDGGRSFGSPELMNVGTADGGLGPPEAVGLVVQNIATAPDGTLYVLKQHDTGLYVTRRVPGAFDQFATYLVSPASTENGFSWLTTDRAGNVYVLAHELRGSVLGAWLYVSRDRGKTWSGGVNLSAGAGGSAFGAIEGGRAGELALVYLRGETSVSSDTQRWWAEVARVTGATTARPHVARVRPLGEPIHTQGICSLGVLCPPGQNRELLDFISTRIARDGHIYAVVAATTPSTAGVPKGPYPTGVVFRSTASR
ncbi:MAG: repeat-like domain [Frankiales bacterium]|nr:repeat-like domain [Frankiales bacterium]